MTRRRTVVVLAVAGGLGAGFGGFVLPSAAQDSTTPAGAPGPGLAPAAADTTTTEATTETTAPSTTAPASTNPRKAVGTVSVEEATSHASHPRPQRSSSSPSSHRSRRAQARRSHRRAASKDEDASPPAECDQAAANRARERRAAKRRRARQRAERTDESVTAAAAPGSAGSRSPGGRRAPAGARDFASGSGDQRLPSLAAGAASDPCNPEKPKQPAQTAPSSTTDRSSSGPRPPSPRDPTYSLATPGPAPVGVPNFFIEKFRIPPFLLSIYQAAGVQYNVPWQVLAAINEIETDYGRNLSVSSAGAMGWMQFIPSSWKTYGVDANADRRKDPYNPVDAIFAAARYLRAAGADTDVRRAIFAYNHADWYVDSVMLRAKLIGGLPAGLVGSLTGLTQGHFPVHARARYADTLAKRDANNPKLVDGDARRRSIDIFARRGAPVIAAQDGVIRHVGASAKLGKYIVLQDAYGNRYTYAHLGSVQSDYPAPKPRRVAPRDVSAELRLPNDPTPTAPASAGRQRDARVRAGTKGARSRRASSPSASARRSRHSASGRTASSPPSAAPAVSVRKERLYAHPGRRAAYRAGGKQQLFESGRLPGFTTFRSYFTQVFGLGRRDVELSPLRKRAKVIAGTILGRLGDTGQGAPHVEFSIRPAGRGAPKIDPKPILDGWKLLESTAVYRAAGKNPFFGSDGQTPTIGQVLLMSKEQLEARALADPRIDIYDCGRKDIQAGQIDRRILATLEFLANSGLKPTVSSLKCGHGYLTKSGNVSEHSSGNAVDIAAINGIPILGHQGKGSITDITIQRLLTLQGTMKPHQIISLMTPQDFAGADNTLALPDHDDHIHIGFPQGLGARGEGLLKRPQWYRLIDRLGHIDNPTVPTTPSKDAIPVKAGEATAASHSHEGE